MAIQRVDFWKKGTTKFVVGLVFLISGVYLFMEYVFTGPLEIAGFPPSAQEADLDRPYGSMSLGDESLTLQNGILTLIDLSNGEKHQVFGSPLSVSLASETATTTIVNEIEDATLGNGFAVWVNVTMDYTDKSDQNRLGTPLEFDLFGYDFTTGQESILLKNFDNIHSHNSPSLAVSGRNIALFTSDGKIHVINFDTKKEVTQIDTTNVLPGFKSFPDPGGWNLLFISNSIIFSVFSPNGYGNALIKYDLTKESFSTLYKAGDIFNLRFDTNSREIYWEENTQGFLEGSIESFHKMNI